MINVDPFGISINPVGLFLAAVFLGLMLILFRWMFAVPPQPPLPVINVRSTLSNLNRILVPLSGSVASERAVELACRLAPDEKAEIVLGAVIVVPLSLSLNTPMRELEEQAQQALDTGTFIVKQHKLRCQARLVRHRSPADGILQLARDIDAEVIVMGAGVPQQRNFGEVSRTALELLRRSPCEVIVAKAPIPA